MVAIRLYQRHLSPRKGFACAYRIHTGRASCSVLGHRAVSRFGVVGGVIVLLRRLRRCGVAHRRLAPRPPGRPRHGMQAGFCDADCDVCNPCEWSSCDVGGLMDGLDCGDSCDFPQRKNRCAADDASVHLPVRSGRPGADSAPPMRTID